MYLRLDSRSRNSGQIRDRIVRTLFTGFMGLALLVSCRTLSAQEPNPGPGPIYGPHSPLGSRECTDCHKRAVSTTLRCLAAKTDLCEFCHQVPPEGGLAQQVRSSEPLCFKCHKRDQFKANYAHGPFIAGACVTCHDPHGGEVPGMLRIAGSQLCLDCHKDFSARFSNASFRHKAAVNNCLDCHSPHMSDQRHLLKSAPPGLCGKCHQGIIGDLQTAAVIHSPARETPSCMNCHDPHMAKEKSLLLADRLDSCLKCHDKPVKGAKEEFADMKKLLEANPYPHGPIQSRDCSTCHNPHSSSYSRLLTNQYAPGFYAPFFISNYSLCFRCHDAVLATEEHTTSTTEFRDGDRNLHYVHVSKASHGRTCRSCHEVHASSGQKHIAKTVPFGNWELPVQYEKTEDGGTCTPGCHTVQKYSRQQGKQ